MPSTRVEVWFDNPAVVKVFISQLKRKRKSGRKTNPYRVHRIKEALPKTGGSASEDNPWTAEFATSDVSGDVKIVFHAVGVNASGKVLATQSDSPDRK